MSKIRVVVADDHPVVLAGLKALIQADPELDLAGDAADGIAALQLIASVMPDIVVLDISMPGIGGVELTRRISEELPSVKALVLTVHEDRAYMQKVLSAGARGYLLKRSAAEELVRAIRAVQGGGLYIDPAIAGKLVGMSAVESVTSGETELSERESEVLKLAAQGHTNKEIAARLTLSVKTVESYKARAMDKLGLRTRAEIVRYGLSQAWLDRG